MLFIYSSKSSMSIWGVLKSALVKFLCLISVKSNLAFIAGSSKHGNARLASVGSKSVVARLN